MHQRGEFAQREVAGKFVLIPLGKTAEIVPGMITMNGTSKFMWELLKEEQTEESLTKALVEAYGITEERALAAARNFLESMLSYGAIAK